LKVRSQSAPAVTDHQFPAPEPRYPKALSPRLIASLERIEDQGREAIAVAADSPERLDEIFDSMPPL
jgi:hypothetical protein